MDTHILVKEMISNNVTNESFTFSLVQNCRKSDCQKSDCRNLAYNTDSDCRKSGYPDQFTMAYEQEYHDQHEHEPFFDMEINIPFAWGEPHEPDVVQSHTIFLQVNDVESAEGYSMESPNLSPEGHEFEFHIGYSDSGSCSDGMVEVLSPADELFYKGQLLPLHLPPRQRMVERLSSLDRNLTEEEEDLDVGAMDNENGGYIPTVAKLIHGERHTPYPYTYCDLAVGENRVRRPNLTIVRSITPCIHGREDEHDNNVFPGCYKDPALQMIQSDVHPYAEWPSPNGCSRLPTECTVLLPSSKRLNPADFGLWGENCEVLDLKHTKKRGFSLLKLRDPASFFKAFFNSRLEPGGLRAHQNARRAPKVIRTEDKEEEEEDEGRRLASYCQRGREHRWSTYMEDRPRKLISSKETHERDKILKKARVYLHKYVKLFKSMYVLLSHTHQEQSKTLLECSSLEYGMSTCGSLSSSSSSSSSRRSARQAGKLMEPKPALKSTVSESLQANSFSRRVRRNSDTIHARFHDEGATCSTIFLQGDTSCGSSCVEVESPIQGAITHCKQSSALPG